MTEPKHTAEPWIHDDYQDCHTITNQGGDQLAEMFSVNTDNCGEANAQRIVDCVNALSGIKDVPGFMEKMEYAIREMHRAWLDDDPDRLQKNYVEARALFPKTPEGKEVD